MTKGQLRKLNVLRKALGGKVADQAFAQWVKEQPVKSAAVKTGPVADKIVKKISALAKDKSFNLGRKGYVVKRAKGRAVNRFVAEKVE